MNWFAKFFGSSNSAESSENGQLGSNEETIEVPESLFVNNNQPLSQEDIKESSPSPVTSYMEQDFYHRGYDDGYDGHSTEVLHNMIKGIKADFRYNLNLKLDEMKQYRFKLQNHQIEIEGLSNTLNRQLEKQIHAVEESIIELESQIALSSLDEGLVMVAIHQYRNGFIQGTSVYQQEKLIAGSTGLFN